MVGIPNKILFPVPAVVYNQFAAQTPSVIWELFEGNQALKITPRPDELSTNSGEDALGNLVLSNYSQKRRKASYAFNLKANLYAYYKILQELQKYNSNPGTAQQTLMIDFINPAPEDTQVNGGSIQGFTRRYGRIANLELIGSTSYLFTQNFVSPPGEFLKEYRCQGINFTFQERGIPVLMTITGTGGTLGIRPLQDEVDIRYLGGENIRDGYSDTFVTVERKRIEIRVNTTLEDIDQALTLVAIRNGQVDTSGVFSSVGLTYDPYGTLSGLIRQVRLPGGIETRTNKTTLSQDLTTSGYSFIFTQI